MKLNRINLNNLMPAMTLALTLTGCARGHHHAVAPAARAPIKVDASTNGDGATKAEAPAEVRTYANPADRYLILAADGKCGDRLVRAFERQLAFREKVKQTLRNRISAYQNAKWFGLKITSQLEAVRETYAFLYDNTQGFENRFAEFTTCERRSDGVELSHARLNADMAELRKAVENLGPLPKSNIKPLIEE